MENFVFPDEIKRKLMKMSKLMNIFVTSHKIMRNRSKLDFFLLMSVSLNSFHFNFSGSRRGTIKL